MSINIIYANVMDEIEKFENDFEEVGGGMSNNNTFSFWFEANKKTDDNEKLVKNYISTLKNKCPKLRIKYSELNRVLCTDDDEQLIPKEGIMYFCQVSEKQ